MRTDVNLINLATHLENNIVFNKQDLKDTIHGILSNSAAGVIKKVQPADIGLSCLKSGSYSTVNPTTGPMYLSRDNGQIVEIRGIRSIYVESLQIKRVMERILRSIRTNGLSPIKVLTVSGKAKRLSQDAVDKRTI